MDWTSVPSSIGMLDLDRSDAKIDLRVGFGLEYSHLKFLLYAQR